MHLLTFGRHNVKIAHYGQCWSHNDRSDFSDLTGRHSSRMRMGGQGLGPQANKFEEVFSDNH